MMAHSIGKCTTRILKCIRSNPTVGGGVTLVYRTRYLSHFNRRHRTAHRHRTPNLKHATFSSGTMGAKSATSDSIPFYDVVIVGGGMAGGALACSLGQEQMLADHKILIIDQGEKPKTFTPASLGNDYSNRVCAINSNSQKLLSDIGAWPIIERLRVKPFHRMQVWDACSDSMITFNHPDLVQEMAHIVENDVTVSALAERLDELKDRVAVKYQNGLTNVWVPNQGTVNEESWVTLSLRDGSKVKARLVVGADGTNSLVRKFGGFNMTKWNYDQSAVVATLHLAEKTENNVAWQRFLPTGPIAMLPLNDNQSSLVWSTSHQEASQLLRMPEDEFIESVNHAFWDDSQHVNSLDTLTQIFEDVLNLMQPADSSSVWQLPPSVGGIQTGSRAKFPLGLSHCMHYVKPRIALIGDAAHRVHPLAGQGINLGFGDVTCLRDVLVKSASLGNDLGSISNLTDYETKRQRHVVPIVVATDALKRLYSTSNPAAVLIRSLGLQATNALKPLKKAIMSNVAR